MSRAELIYPLRKRIESELAKVQSDPHNREVLMRYYKVRSTEVELATIVTAFIKLNVMSQMLNKRFEDSTREDIEDLIFRIDQKRNKPNTLNKYRKILKLFFRWLRNYPAGDYPSEVKWITLKKVPFITVTAEDLISFDDALRISEQASNLRDKALFQCKLDAGCRIGEILTVRLGEVKFNEAGAILYTDGKTGPQPCILTWSASILAQWLNIHPFRDDKDAPVFCQFHNRKLKQMSYSQARQVFKECGVKAGFTNRRIWLHLLKHVSSTEDANRGISQSFRNYKHHWTPNSRMSQVYEHLSASVIPNIQRETWSKVVGQDKIIQVKEEPIQVLRGCRRCAFENTRDSAFCNRCGYPLDEREAAEKSITKTRVDELVARLTEKPELVEKLLSVVKP